MRLFDDYLSRQEVLKHVVRELFNQLIRKEIMMMNAKFQKVEDYLYLNWIDCLFHLLGMNDLSVG
jgi:hypothetical protein